MISFLTAFCLFAYAVTAVDNAFIHSTSLLTCMENSQFTASRFDVKFFRSNSSLTFDISAISNIDSNVTVKANLIAYGLNVMNQEIDLCSLKQKLPALCPFTTGHLDIASAYQISPSIMSQIPGIAFTVPDIDARVRVVFYESGTNATLACVEAVLSNGKTVQTKYAAWPIAAIAGLGVVTSGVVSVIGHSNTAAHIASNSLSLFIYFQSLAITAMLAVAKIPPIAAAWAQNFMWSVGIVKAGFIQKFANWYLQLTGGSPTDILSSLQLSISVQKRGLSAVNEALSALFVRLQRNDHLTLFKRITVDPAGSSGTSDQLDLDLYTINEKDPDLNSKILVLRGMRRVAYLTGIEITSLFMTGISFLIFFAFVMVVCLTLFKAIIEILIRSKMMNEGKFNEYRQQWPSIIKGSLYRLLIIALPQIVVLCLWEFTQRDSAGIMVVAVFLFLIGFVLLLQASIRVIIKGVKSQRQFKNPAYFLFGDGVFLNKFGFLYVQYRADCYWFIMVSLLYLFFKSLFVAVLQSNGKVLSVLVFVAEVLYLVTVCVLRPYMDKRTNAFNITICVINAINALFFMFFSYVFKEPQIVSSVMGIVYFVLNAVFALFLLIFTIVTCLIALLYKNPDTRYQPMKDDRVSFLPRFDNKKGAANTTEDDMELFELGATAMKGHVQNGTKGTIFDDEDSAEFGKPLAPRGQYSDSFSNYANKESPSLSSKGSSGAGYGRDGDYRSASFNMNSVEPTQQASTIVGDPSNAMGGLRGYKPRSASHR